MKWAWPFGRSSSKVCWAFLFTLVGARQVNSQQTLPSGGDRSLILLYTNDTRGFLEDCGCQSRQRGGLARRATLIQQIRSECPQVLLLDSGNLADTGPRLETVLGCMERMGYQGSGLGVFDLLLGPLLFPAAQQKGVPLINSFPEENRLPPSVQKSSIFRVGGRRVGVIGLSPGPQEPSPEEFYARLEALLADLRPRVDLVVLLSQLGLERDRAMAQGQRDHHLIDLIIGNREARALSAPEVIGRTWIVPTSERGEHLGVVEVRFTEQRPQFTCRLLPVESDRYPPDPEIQALVDDYRRKEAEVLRQTSLRRQDGAGGPKEAPEAGFVPDFLPADQCGRCHASQYQAWRKQKHAQAAAALQSRNRLVPECLTCHSEGFRRTETFVWQDDLIDGVQCSTCHGDGVLHSLLNRREHIVRQPPEPETFCRTCHNVDHDPNFSYMECREAIRHW